MSVNQVCTRCKDTSSWNKVTPVQKRQCNTKKRYLHRGPPLPSPPLPLGHPIDRDDNGPMTHHYPWPSSRHQMGRELSLSRERPLRKYRSAQRDKANQRGACYKALLPTLLCQNQLIQSVHKPGEMLANQTCRQESCFHFNVGRGGSIFCICLRQPEEWLWSEIKQKASRQWHTISSLWG